MNKALTSLLLSAIQPTFKRYLDNNLVNITTQSFWDVFQSFPNHYSRVTPQDVNKNLKRTKVTWIHKNPLRNCSPKSMTRLNTVSLQGSLFRMQHLSNMRKC